MTRALCWAKPPEWWETGDPGNRLALGFCDICPSRTGTTCNAGVSDPRPHGVVRAAVAYSDAGSPLPRCGECGYPRTNYTGGALGECPWCGVPEIKVPPAAFRTLVTNLHRQGLGPTAIANRIGAKHAAVKSACRRWGLTHQSLDQMKEAAA